MRLSDLDWDQMLGRGTYGDVYLGKYRRGALVVDAAVKVAPRLGDSIELQTSQIYALRKEVLRHAAVSRHPGIVGILDVGIASEKQIGVVFELYAVNLEDLLRKLQVAAREFLPQSPNRATRIEPAGRRHILGTMCGALAHMHAKGVVHGDVSPKNVLLRGGAAASASWLNQLLDPPPPEIESEICALRNHLPSAIQVEREWHWRFIPAGDVFDLGTFVQLCTNVF